MSNQYNYNEESEYAANDNHYTYQQQGQQYVDQDDTVSMDARTGSPEYQGYDENANNGNVGGGRDDLLNQYLYDQDQSFSSKQQYSNDPKATKKHGKRRAKTAVSNNLLASTSHAGESHTSGAHKSKQNHHHSKKHSSKK